MRKTLKRHLRSLHEHTIQLQFTRTIGFHAHRAAVQGERRLPASGTQTAHTWRVFPYRPNGVVGGFCAIEVSDVPVRAAMIRENCVFTVMQKQNVWLCATWLCSPLLPLQIRSSAHQFICPYWNALLKFPIIDPFWNLNTLICTGYSIDRHDCVDIFKCSKPWRTAVSLNQTNLIHQKCFRTINQEKEM